MHLSVVIPARNEAATIGMVLSDLDTTLKQLPFQSEVIVVDDHSIDGTANAAEGFKVKLIQNTKPPGKGNALRTGFETASGDLIVMMDADFSHRAEDISKIVDKLKEGYGLIIGSRAIGGSDEYEIIRLFGNVFLSACFRFMFRTYVRDALNGFKGFRREVFTSFPYHSRGFEIEIELLANALALGTNVGEVESHERMRAGGRMKSRAHVDGPKFLFAIIRFGVRNGWRRFRGFKTTC